MKLKLPLFLLIAFSLIVISISCNSGGGSSSPAGTFDTAGWETTDHGNGITQLMKKDGNGNPLQSGYLVNGVKEGVWIEYHDDGDNIMSITPYVRGTVTGPVLTYSNRSQLESMKSFANDILHGPSNTYKYGKVTSRTPFEKGIINGKFQEYLNSKLQREIDYVNGKKDGKIVYYDEEGNVTVEYQYKNDQKISGGMIEK